MLDKGQAIKHLTAGVLTGMQAAWETYRDNFRNYVVTKPGGSSDSITALWQLFAQPVNSGKLQETYAMFGRPPLVSEDFGDFDEGTVPEYTFDLRNRDWKDSFAVSIYAIDDDQTGDIEKQGQQLMEQFFFHQDKLLLDIFASAAANTPVGYDGGTLIADAGAAPGHSGGAQNDNNTDGPLTEAAFRTAFMAMRTFTDSQGQQPAFSTANVILCGTQWQWAAIEVALSAARSSGTGGAEPWPSPGGAPVLNPMGFWNQTIVCVPFSLAAGNWHLFDSSKAWKACIMQMRKQPTLSVSSPQSDEVHLRNRVSFIVRGRYVVGPGYWQRVIRGRLS